MQRTNEDRYSGSSKKARTSSPVKSSHSSHKSRDRESTVSSKTEFEIMLGMNDEIIKSKKSSKSKKESKSPKSSRKSESVKESSDKNRKEIKKEVKTEKPDKCYVKSERIDESPSKSHRHTNGMPKDLETKPSFKPMDPSDILSSLPTANYKPLPDRDFIEDRMEANRRKMLKANEDLSISIQSKKGRTAVFAGQARAKTYDHVPRLEDLCLQVLMDNYEKLSYLGYAPYYLLKPVLQKCNTRQLIKIEKYNPDIMNETDELWQEFCKKEFRGREPDEDEDETWRDLYFRCTQEREDRLKNITKNISHKQAKALPVRQTQFSDSVKTPREILRKQERSGFTAINPKPGHSGGHSSAHVKIVPEKPKVAPLMRKVLKLQKVRYRR